MSCNRNSNVKSCHRLLSQYTGSRFTVLVFQSILHILHRKAEVSQASRVHPNLHGVITATYIGYTSYTRNTAQKVENVDSSKVTQVDFVKLRIIGSQAESHKLAGSLFLYFNTILHYLGWQTRFGQFDTVLNFYGSQIRVGRNVKSNRCRKASRVGAVRLHIKHARCTIEFLLNRCCHSLRHGQSTGTRIRGTDFHHRWSNLRILIDGKHCQANDAHDNNQYGDDGREHRPVYEKAYFHLVINQRLSIIFPLSRSLPCE